MKEINIIPTQEERLNKMSKEDLVQLILDADDALGYLVSNLHKEFCYTQLATEEQWNEDIAPRLMDLSLILDGYKIGTPTARVYKFPKL